MKDENETVRDNLIAGAVFTVFVGPCSLFLLPSAIKEYKDAKERRLTRETQAYLDEQVMRAKEQADAQQRAMLIEAGQRELELKRRREKLERERHERETKLYFMRGAIEQAKAKREQERVETQAWLDNYYVMKARRRVAMRNIYPQVTQPSERNATDEDIAEFRKSKGR
jgi:hypothetical protein